MIYCNLSDTYSCIIMDINLLFQNIYLIKTLYCNCILMQFKLLLLKYIAFEQLFLIQPNLCTNGEIKQIHISLDVENMYLFERK